MHKFAEQGITVAPVPYKVGDRITIIYDGHLSKNGADQIYLHYGYGFSNWNNTTDVYMEKSPQGWQKSLNILSEGQFNFCFKDSAGNWDNNSGMNWSYRITR